jgi:hypothetical protein
MIKCNAAIGREPRMEFSKDQIIDLIRQQGDEDKASQAEQELPSQVDTDRDAGLLSKFGIDPQDLISKLGGNIPGLG